MIALAMWQLENLGSCYNGDIDQAHFGLTSLIYPLRGIESI
jgi:hypothetical protein